MYKSCLRDQAEHRGIARALVFISIVTAVTSRRISRLGCPATWNSWKCSDCATSGRRVSVARVPSQPGKFEWLLEGSQGSQGTTIIETGLLSRQIPITRRRPTYWSTVCVRQRVLKGEKLHLSIGPSLKDFFWKGILSGMYRKTSPAPRGRERTWEKGEGPKRRRWPVASNIWSHEAIDCRSYERENVEILNSEYWTRCAQTRPYLFLYVRHAFPSGHSFCLFQLTFFFPICFFPI